MGNNQKFNRNKGKETESFKGNSGRKRNFRGAKPSSDKTTTGNGLVKCNDASWYLHNPLAAADVANFAYATPMGYKMNLRPWVRQSTTPWARDNRNWQYECTPGVLGLEVSQVAPKSTDADSALNVAMHNLYTDIRYMNSGSRNYDAPDLFIYVFAQISLRAYISWMERTYAFAKMYTQENGYMPHAYYAVNHLDWNSFRGRESMFHDGITQRLHQLKKWYVPGDMDIFHRYAFLYRDVYTEGTSWKDQQYMFVPSSFMKFTFDDDGAGMMEQRYIRDGEYLSMEDVFSIFDELYDAVNAEEDFHIMSGDIYKAKGDSCLPLNLDFPKDYSIAPVFSIEVLEQIKNARCVGGDYASGINSLHQDATKAYLISEPKSVHTFTYGTDAKGYCKAAAATLNSLYDHIVLTTSTSKVGSALTMVNSRLCVMSENRTSEDTGTAFVITDDLVLGTELPYRFIIADYEVSNTTGLPRDLALKIYEYAHNLNDSAVATDVHNALRMVNNLSNFKFHPAVECWVTTGDGTSDNYDVHGIDLFYDIDNFQVMDQDNVERVHNVAILSLFGIYG